MKMRSIFIHILLSLSITTQMCSYFISGSVYKNEKNGSWVVLLGDRHVPCEEKIAEKQRPDLIRGIKSYPKELTLTLSEGAQSRTSRNEGISPALVLTDLVEEGFNVIGADTWRKMLSNYIVKKMCSDDIMRLKIKKIVEMGLEKEKKHIKENAYEREFEKNILLEVEPTTFEDVLKEFNQNIKMIEQYEKEIEQLKQLKWIDESFAKNLLNFYAETKKRIIETTKDDIASLKSKDGINKGYALKCFLVNTVGFLDIPMIHAMVKNKDKKVVFICAGALHMQNIGDFLCKSGYKLMKQERVTSVLSVRGNEKPINIKELLKKLPKWSAERRGFEYLRNRNEIPRASTCCSIWRLLCKPFCMCRYPSYKKYRRLALKKSL